MLPAAPRQGFGSNPALIADALADRAERAADRAASRARTQIRKKKIRAKVIQRQRAERQQRAAVTAARTESREYAGRHRAAPAPRVKVKKTVIRTRPVVHKKAAKPKRVVRNTAARRGMSAVTAYARAQVGDRYQRGAIGPNRFDCSGLVKKAYSKAGIHLPHSSGGIAARARTISRSQARPGDLVVGPGHVGIYMGGGMMIDAGNSRVGVVYRKMYRGLHIERLS
jgi:cell wall-associated NlpC family hydrolase